MDHPHKSTSADEKLWKATNIDMEALQHIVSSHFGTKCQNYTRMNEGAYARAFLLL
jgi:hypothetical protein